MLAVWAVAFAMLAVVAALPSGPAAVLVVDDPYPALGQAVHFNASSSTGHDAGNGRIVAYNFSFGDGFATGWQPSALAEHAYAAAGTFAASVTVADARGEESEAYATVQPGTLPPPSQAPDLVPIQAQLAPASPTVNDSLHLTVVILNRGGAADAATVHAIDAPENASPSLVAAAVLPGPIPASGTVSAVLGPFALAEAGNHTLRILVTNVSPPETATADHELDLRVLVLPGSPPANRGGGPAPSVSPLVLGLGAAAVAAAAGAALLFLRPAPPGPLDPPPPSPQDRSPPPIWPL